MKSPRPNPIFFAAITLTILLSLMFNSSKAQVAYYTFQDSTGTYTPITGTAFASYPWDDSASGIITIPFVFYYNFIPFSTLFINTNGFITLGNVPPPTQASCGLQGTNGNSIGRSEEHT